MVVISAEAEQTDSVGRDTDRLPEGVAVLLFHDAFLSAGAVHVVCVEGQAKEWSSGVIPGLHRRKGASLRVVQNDSFPKLRRMVAWIPGEPVDSCHPSEVKLAESRSGDRPMAGQVPQRREGG